MKKKNSDNSPLFFYLFVAIAVLVALMAVSSVLTLQKTVSSAAEPSTRMQLTSFDKKLGLKLMDANNDGICDVCGMSVQMCLDSGQLECNMVKGASIGVLQSAHVHADWKIFVNGEALGEAYFKPFARDKSKPDVGLTSSFIHVETDALTPAGEKLGEVLHVHASGVPLWIFFASIGGSFNESCLVLPGKGDFCNSGSKKLKLYVNGQPRSEFGNYSFSDLDMILISYGVEEDVSSQLASITGFAKAHQQPH